MTCDTRSTVVLVAVAAVLTAILLQACASARNPVVADTVPGGWPIPPETVVVTSGFGARHGGSHHDGIDLSAPEGTPVKATARGRVVFSGRSGRWGRMVVVDHGDGWPTRYAHLKRVKGDRGKKLGRGEIVGTVGRSGNATGFHLHYEVLRNGKPVNPRPFLER
jgi:murein DD-endopeptidase MepM/ murein hydrolase activator NlpD